MNQFWEKHNVVRGQDTLKRILPVIGRNGWIGGSFAAFAAYPGDCPVLPGDIDVFARSAWDADRIARRFQRSFNLSPWGADDNGTVISLVGTPLPVQIVRPNPTWKVFPDDILSDFDLDICRAVIVDETTVLADKNVGYHFGKLLRINNPLRSLKRVMKYAARGVEFDDHELLKLFEAWDAATPERKKEIIEAARAPEPDGEPSYDAWDYDEDDWFDGE